MTYDTDTELALLDLFLMDRLDMKTSLLIQLMHLNGVVLHL